MSIQNGKDRIEEIKRAMHRAIDDLFENHIEGKSCTGFTVSFDCGVDRVLSETLHIDHIVQGDDNHFLIMFLEEKEAENERSEEE